MRFRTLALAALALALGTSGCATSALIEGTVGADRQKTFERVEAVSVTGRTAAASVIHARIRLSSGERVDYIAAEGPARVGPASSFPLPQGDGIALASSNGEGTVWAGGADGPSATFYPQSKTSFVLVVSFPGPEGGVPESRRIPLEVPPDGPWRVAKEVGAAFKFAALLPLAVAADAVTAGLVVGTAPVWIPLVVIVIANGGFRLMPRC